MKRKALVILTLAALAAPFAASALTLGDLQAQLSVLQERISGLIASPSANVSTDTQTTVSILRICSVLPTRALYLGVRGDDVVSLQEFLRSEGVFSANATGYFGPITAQALTHWQASQGVSAIGVAGPLTRERIRARCSNPPPTPTCRPITYMPVLCPDGATPQAQHNESGCIIGYECPVANFVPPANCKAWNDGCNICSRQTPNAPAMCTARACFAAGKGYCTTYFDTTANRPPVISGFSGPTTLTVNASGTWTINASDPENEALSYHVTWGDESSTPFPYAGMAMMPDAFVQTTTFTHAYASAGTYTVTIVVRDSSGQEAQTSTTVQVGAGVVCTMEYTPVCGQPPEPACRRSIPACMMATPGPQTYSNRCVMNAAGATFMYDGACTTY